MSEEFEDIIEEEDVEIAEGAEPSGRYDKLLGSDSGKY